VLFQQNHGSGDINESQKGCIQLVISGKHSAEPFDLLEEALRQMTSLVCMLVNRPMNLGIPTVLGYADGFILSFFPPSAL